MNEEITEFDIIKEVGSICACHSTLAFSQMIDRSIELEAPKLDLIATEDVEKIISIDTTVVVGVHTQLLSGVTGQVSLLFSEKSAYEFVEIFKTSQNLKHGFLTALGVSAIKEIGNIVVSAYSGAMSLLMDVPVIPSIPMLSSGPLSEVLRFGFSSLDAKEQKLYVHTMTFKDDQGKIKGSFYFLIEPDTMRTIIDTMRKNLAKIKNLKSGLKK